MSIEDMIAKLNETADGNTCDGECCMIEPCKECQSATAMNTIKEFVEELYEEIFD